MSRTELAVDRTRKCRGSEQEKLTFEAGKAPDNLVRLCVYAGFAHSDFGAEHVRRCVWGRFRSVIWEFSKLSLRSAAKPRRGGSLCPLGGSGQTALG